jgi:hypothetical protein
VLIGRRRHVTSSRAGAVWNHARRGGGAGGEGRARRGCDATRARVEYRFTVISTLTYEASSSRVAARRSSLHALQSRGLAPPPPVQQQQLPRNHGGVVDDRERIIFLWTRGDCRAVGGQFEDNSDSAAL